MIDTLITYLPYSRLYEIRKYYIENIKRIKPLHAIVYVDDVFTEEQISFLSSFMAKEFEVRTGFWRNRTACFLQILIDLKKEKIPDALIVDSDNILDNDFSIIDQELLSEYDFYTVMDWEGLARSFIKRSIKLKNIEVNGKRREVYGYKLTGTWNGIFFLGPKQAVRVTQAALRKLNDATLEDIYKAIQSLDPSLANRVVDETPLAILFYYSGIKITPWVVCSRHYYNQVRKSTKNLYTRRLLKSTAHVGLARGLVKWKYKRIWLFYFRYKIAQLFYSLLVLIFDR
jgi:hypothetical protein